MDEIAVITGFPALLAWRSNDCIINPSLESLECGCQEKLFFRAILTELDNQ